MTVVSGALPSPSAPQQQLIDILGSVYLEHGQWPSWAYVEEKMERLDLDGAAVLASLPRGAHNYGAVWPMRQGAPTPDTRVGLTVAGMSNLAGGELVVDAFVRLVGAMAAFRADVELDPFSDTRPRMTRGDVLALAGAFEVDEGRLLDLMQKEPPTWHCQANRPSPDDWTIELAPEIRRFAGVRDVAGYLDRLSRYTSPPARAPEEKLVSPFTLPGSIDYLDAVWRLRFGERLVVPPGVERSARLAYAAASPEETDNRLSALAELLKQLNVPGAPGVSGHPLSRLRRFLTDALPQEAHARVYGAIEVLDAARQARAASQHQAAQRDAIDAYHVLGLSFPVTNWSAAWQRIQAVVTLAFDAIRDELQAND